MVNFKTWVGPGGTGVFSVDAKRWNDLWAGTDWPTRFTNDPVRARKEWDAELSKESK